MTMGVSISAWDLVLHASKIGRKDLPCFGSFL
jgi:hypothetical protein